MNKDEEKLRSRILNRDPLDSSDRDLLESSAEWRQLKEVTDRLADHKPAEPQPPKPLDEAILQHARKARKPVLRFPVWRVAAAAAGVAIALIIMTMILKHDEQPTIVHNDPPRIETNKTAPIPNKEQNAETSLEFRWEDDPIEEQLSVLEAELMIQEADAETAALVEDLAL